MISNLSGRSFVAHEPFTLALSSGFFGFYAHVGFLKALDEFDISPSSYTGSSAGAIVAAAAARGMTTQEIEKLVLSVSRKEFWDPCPGFGFLRGRKLQKLIETEIGSDFSQLQKPLRIPAFDLAGRSTHVFTSGNLARVVRATCAVPVMFHPVRINKRFYLDGGIQDKMAVHGLPVEEKILSHYLESSRQDPHSIYEFKRDIKSNQARGKNLTQILLKDLPKAGPFALHRGPEIIEAAYQKARAAFRNLPVNHA